MKDLYEVLRQKEQEYKRLAKEIEALRITASLLAEQKPENAADSAKTAIAVAAAGNAGPRMVEEAAPRWP